jgi:signal transduction histidine kinase
MSSLLRLRRFRNSFRFRLFIIFTLGTALITFFLSATYIIREKIEFREHTAERARLLVAVLGGNARLPLFGNDRALLQRLAEETAQQPDVTEVYINNSSGDAVADIHHEAAVSGTITESLKITSHAEDNPHMLAMTGKNAPISLGEVRVSLDTSRLDNSIRKMSVSIALYATIFWLIVIMVSYLGLNRLTRSYLRLMEGLATMRAGNLETRILVEGSDEPSQAARSVNELAEALQQREADNKALQEKLISAMRIQVQEEKQQIMAKLIQTNRMTSLGLLVSSMAHEINNPNGAIRLDGNFLGKMLNDMVPALEKIASEDPGFNLCGMEFNVALKEIFLAHKNLIHNTDRIDSVIKDLRAYSLGAGTPFVPNIDLNRVVSGALTIIRAHGHFTNATIREDLSPVLPVISGSHYQLEQIVVNLLLNALHSLPYQGGKVTIGTASAPETSEILITIRDTGVGIPPENIARLYEPFFSTRIETGGSGLGLYISNFIIGEHGGHLEFESEVGVGTTVVMHLPLPQPEHSI